jgi:hypothetical protein
VLLDVVVVVIIFLLVVWMLCDESFLSFLFQEEDDDGDCNRMYSVSADGSRMESGVVLVISRKERIKSANSTQNPRNHEMIERKSRDYSMLTKNTSTKYRLMFFCFFKDNMILMLWCYY